MDVRNNKVVVVGLGTSGLDAALLLSDNEAIVYATDSSETEDVKKNARILSDKYIEIEIGKHTEEFLEDADMMVVSPGVPKNAVPIRYALERDIPVISEMELGFLFCRGPVIAVTGTNGKSTVVTLLGEVLKKAGRDCVVCGNIGNSLCGEIKRVKPKTVVVLEVSSFQLEWIREFSPAVSCILNITEDHLERYRDMMDYADAKYRIFSKQNGNQFVILNYDDPLLKNIAKPITARPLYYSAKEKPEGIYFHKGKFMLNLAGDERELFDMPLCALKGTHNIENIMAVTLMAMTQKVKPVVIKKALEGYKLLNHRVEKVMEIRGVVFYDDSKGTNIDATKRALEAMERRVVLIAGGRDKGGDYAKIKKEIKEKVKKIILIGESAGLIRKAYDGLVDMVDAKSLEEATAAAFKSAVSGEAVLLSPMCSSFDMFTSYKHRGEVFQRTIKEMAAQNA